METKKLESISHQTINFNFCIHKGYILVLLYVENLNLIRCILSEIELHVRFGWYVSFIRFHEIINDFSIPLDVRAT